MKTKKIPMRTCVVSHEKLPKGELIRVVRTPEGEVIIDETGRANGRGAYVKRDKEVILKARKTKLLERALETTISEDVYEKLDSMC
jgi:hypothetical protein